MSVINVLMQLRKVCNHPDLFEPRPIHSPFVTEGICFVTASLVLRALDPEPFKVTRGDTRGCAGTCGDTGGHARTRGHKDTGTAAVGEVFVVKVMGRRGAAK